MSAACKLEVCTVADTGRCALEKDPAGCENRDQSVPIKLVANINNVSNIAEAGLRPDDGGLGGPVLASRKELASFPRSTTLGSEVISRLMSTRYVNVVGILGDPGSGKTACLASLYLLVANDLLPGWSFADSRSLMAFEELARGARRWNEGAPPEQMTVRTELADDRRPGFLHLRLRRNSDGRCVDLALPDLPGEWTKALVRTSRSDRFEFLKSADVLWVVVDGRTLHSKEQRQGVVSRIGQLIGRLEALFNGSIPRIVLVVTHRDQGEPPAAVLERIQQEVDKYKVSLTIVPVAPFSDKEHFKAGFGLPHLVEETVGPVKPAPPTWASGHLSRGTREFLAYRRTP